MGHLKKSSAVASYEIAYQNDPEMLEAFRKMDQEDQFAMLVAVLHEYGYKYSEIWALTFIEVKGLMYGAGLLAEKRKAANK